MTPSRRPRPSYKTKWQRAYEELCDTRNRLTFIQDELNRIRGVLAVEGVATVNTLQWMVERGDKVLKLQPLPHECYRAWADTHARCMPERAYDPMALMTFQGVPVVCE